MKRFVLMPFVAALLLFAGCDGDPTGSETSASVRFLHATAGMTGKAGFTANRSFVNGSALSFGQATPGCSTVAAGPTSFGFGVANSAGTGVTNSVAALNGQTLTAGGHYTLMASGSEAAATLFLLEDGFSGELGSTQAAIRFVNLVSTPGNPVNLLKGNLQSGGTQVVATNLTVGSPTAFATVASGSTEYTVLRGHDIVASGNEATFNLQAGTVTTVAIVSADSGGVQLISLPRCS